MTTIEIALALAIDNNVRVCDDHKEEAAGRAPAFTAFLVYTNARRVKVCQLRAGSRTWRVQVDTLFTGTRAQCIVEAVRFCKEGAWK